MHAPGIDTYSRFMPSRMNLLIKRHIKCSMYDIAMVCLSRDFYVWPWFCDSKDKTICLFIYDSIFAFFEIIYFHEKRCTWLIFMRCVDPECPESGRECVLSAQHVRVFINTRRCAIIIFILCIFTEMQRVSSGHGKRSSRCSLHIYTTHSSW